MKPVTVTGSLLLNSRERESAKNALHALYERKDLGYLRLPLEDEAWQRCQTLANQLKAKSKRLIVIGMGGSHWGGRGLVEALGSHPSNVEFWGESEPELLERRWAQILAPAQKHFLIVSKSGSTLEVATMLNALHSYLKGYNLKLTRQCTVVTEEKSNPLYDWASNNDVPVVAHPQDVGGRFSVFTPVGLLPAAYGGVNLTRVREGALWAMVQTDMLAELVGAFAASFSRGEKISVFWAYIHRLAPFLPWLEQLWAESLGKAKGRTVAQRPQVSTPLTALGVSAQHSVLQQFIEGEKDKFFVFFRSQELAHKGEPFQTSVLPGFEYLAGKTAGEIYDVQSRATEQSLIESGRSTLSIELNRLDEFTYGALLMTFEIVVGALGELLDLNAFDQPGVELGKKIAKRHLEGTV